VDKDVMRMVEGQRTRDACRIYLQKTYLKTASPMAKGARAAVTFG
jgi:hexaprenyl-diphosphate synthase